MDLITHSLTPVIHINGIRSLIGVGKPCRAPNPFSALPPSNNYTRLVLKLFRGEPAITEFDWPFTPSHSSSKPFSTDPGSDFHVMLLTLPPGHGKITQLRVYRMQLCRPIKTRFRYGSVPTTLNLAAYDNSPAHYAKGTPSGPKTLRLLVSAWFQVLFHSPPGVLFTFPSRYWFTIGNRRIFSLSRWSCWIPARFLVSRGTWEHSREIRSFRLRGYHPLWPDFPDCSTII